MPPPAHIPLVSVIVPCYNAAPWLNEALDSSLGQTYPHIEVIVVDDGSTDGSCGILSSYGDAVRWETGPNRGGNHARNRALALSRGQYIQYLDADDYLLPEKIERQVRFLEETGADVVYGDYRHQYHTPDRPASLGPVTVTGEKPDVLAALLDRWLVAVMALLFRREAVVNAAGWDETLRAGQDHDFFISVVMAGADVRYQPGCFSVYRRYGNTTVSTRNSQMLLESTRQLFEKAEEKLTRSEGLKPEHREALARTFFMLARTYYDTDRRQYERLLRKVFDLSPSFRPTGSVLYRSAQAVLGYDWAERLASSKRRLRDAGGWRLLAGR